MATITEESVLTKKQTKRYGPKAIDYHGTPAVIVAEVRFDDECGNGHNTFAITGDIRAVDRRVNRHGGGWLAGGCLHDEIREKFPELTPFIKWHLCSTDGPMHYLANTLFMAGDKDCWGKRKGDVTGWEFGVRFNGVPVTHRLPEKFWTWARMMHGQSKFKVRAIAHVDREGEYKYSPHYTFQGFAEKWHECPFRDKTEAEEMCDALNGCEVQWIRIPVRYSDGKERELDSARRASVWLEATDEELIADGLKERLEARLPALLAEFRRDVESLGFVW